MTLDRDELAARFAVADLSNPNFATDFTDAKEVARWAAGLKGLADALLAALVPIAPASGAPAPLPGAPLAAPSPAASPAAYVPKVGDVVRHHSDDPGINDRVVTTVGSDRFTMRSVLCPPSESFGYDAHTYWRYLRPATAAERVAAGLDAPAPAVDREGLARELCGAWWGRPMGEWDATPCDRKADWLRAADAAIAFMAKGGAK